jgi:hypothetical protein
MQSDVSPIVEAFIASLEMIPWFSRVGQAISDDPTVRRITDWKEWPGPEDEPVHDYCLDQQRPLDEILLEFPELKPEWEFLWRRTQEIVVRLAGNVVSYDPAQDSWHGPTLSVWSVAFPAALIALHKRIAREPPANLLALWQWYLSGRWPCGYACSEKSGEPRLLLVL